MKLKKFLLAFALLLVIVPCAALFAACGGTPTQSYTVTFVDYDDSVIDTQTVKAGEDATAPADPTRDGYTFAGWDIEFNDVTGNITVKATYVQEFTVTFVDHNGTVLKTETVNSGAPATAPTNPSREGFRFDGWDKTFNNVTGNLTVTAKYINLIVGDWKFDSITFHDELGELVVMKPGDRPADDQAQITERYMSFSFTETEVNSKMMVGDTFIETTGEYFKVKDIAGDILADLSPDEEGYDEIVAWFATFSEGYIILSLFEYIDTPFILIVDENENLRAYFIPEDGTTNYTYMTFVSGKPAPAEPIVNRWELSEFTMIDGEGEKTIYVGDINGNVIIETNFVEISIDDGHVGGDFTFSYNDTYFEGTWIKNEDGTYTLTSEDEGAYYPKLTGAYEEGHLTLTIEAESEEGLEMTVGSIIKFIPSEEDSDSIVRRWCDDDENYTDGNVILTFFNNGKVSGWYNDQTALGYWTNNGNGTYTITAYSGISSFGQITEESVADVNLTFELTEDDGYPVLSMIVGETSYDFRQGTKTFTVEFKETENTNRFQWNIQYMSTVSYEGPDPKREGFNFLGWKVEGTEDTAIIDLGIYNITSDTTFVAVWEISGIVGGTWSNCIGYTDNTYTQTIEGGSATQFTFSEDGNFNGDNLPFINQIEGTYTLEETVYGFSGENMEPVASYFADAQIVDQKLRIQMTITIPTGEEEQATINYYWEFTKNS